MNPIRASLKARSLGVNVAEVWHEPLKLLTIDDKVEAIPFTHGVKVDCSVKFGQIATCASDGESIVNAKNEIINAIEREIYGFIGDRLLDIRKSVWTGSTQKEVSIMISDLYQEIYSREFK